MSNYSTSYKDISKIIYQTNKRLIDDFAKSSDKELMESAKMMIAAAGSQK